MDAAHQKLSNFVAPNIEFKGDLTKMKLLQKIQFNFYRADKILLFKGYLLINTGNGIALLEKETYKTIFKQEFETESIMTINKIDEDSLVIATLEKIILVKFEENQPKNITCEIIQEICETSLYYTGLILSNDLLLVAGEDQKFVFYQLENYNEDKKFSKNNLYKKIAEIENVHNVLEEDLPNVIDLNNGLLLSYTNIRADIKICQYDGEFKLIKSIEKYEWDTAELISNKYVILRGCGYPDYNICLFDVEKLEIIKTWETSNRDFFIQPICENKFFSGSNERFAICELKEEKNEITLKDVYITDYQGFDIFSYPLVLDEKTFLTCAYDKSDNSDSDDLYALTQRNGYLLVFRCE